MKCCLKPVVPAPAGACIRCHIAPARRRIAHFAVSHFANRLSPCCQFRRFEFRFLDIYFHIYLLYTENSLWIQVCFFEFLYIVHIRLVYNIYISWVQFYFKRKALLCIWCSLMVKSSFVIRKTLANFLKWSQALSTNLYFATKGISKCRSSVAVQDLLAASTSPEQT